MERKKRMLAALLSVLLFLGALSLPGCASRGNNRFFSGDALEYYNSLVDAGFPKDYAEELTELHLLHPNWIFLPLDIASTDKSFTWGRVIDGETEEPQTNLIYSLKSYSNYWHPFNRETYDAGYYQASEETVEYFMDPRNFFNETDIFQFYDLASGKDVPLSAVEAVLKGSFMENTVLENGKTYAQNFLEIGTALGVHPVYLAVKAYQEQGADGTSAIISGDCGTTLWEFFRDGIKKTSSGNEICLPESADKEELLALDGYYNLFNVGASGKGVFNIYKNAMEYARKGSEEMAEAWGGNGSWDTVWKSIYGGAMLLKKTFIDRYQSTVYLQKFNVDGRSGRNFWGQYMQNVAGAMTESRTLYQAFAAISALDAPCTFLIPVYKKMPKKPCPDPAGGACSALKTADQKFDFSVNFSSPVNASYTNLPVYDSVTLEAGGSLDVTAKISHDYGISRLEYSVDGKDWSLLGDDGSIVFSLPADSFGAGEHILIIRGIANYDHTNSYQKSNKYFLCAVLYVTVSP